MGQDGLEGRNPVNALFGDQSCLMGGNAYRIDIEKFSAQGGIDPNLLHKGNVELFYYACTGTLTAVAKAMSRDVKVETTTTKDTTKTTEKNRTTNLACRGSLPVSLVDHLKLAAYPPVARYIRWAKQQERYRDDGGRAYGAAFCRWLIRSLRPARRRIHIKHVTAITNRIEKTVVQDVHIHRHICPHLAVGENTHIHMEFLREPDHDNHYLIAFARSLVEWGCGKDGYALASIDRGGYALGYAKAICRQHGIKIKGES